MSVSSPEAIFHFLFRTQHDQKNNTQSLPIDHILPERESYVVTSNDQFSAPGATIVTNMHDVYKTIDDNDTRNVFILGGYHMFIQALTWAYEIRMTIIKGNTYDCDVFFPVQVLNKKWKIVSGEETDTAYYVVYNRNK